MITEDILIQITQRFEFLEAQMAEGSSDIAKLAKEYSDLKPVVEEVRAYQGLVRNIADAEAMLEDLEMRELAKEELPILRAALPKAEYNLQITLLPKDAADARSVIME
ncbi:PCRF domain-containing protein, partial [Planktomarina sp.]|nr:PCRF domain-containing protein [Planktomarina sp.]